jgi:site-specific recombinase
MTATPTTDGRLPAAVAALLAAEVHEQRADAFAEVLRLLLAPRRREAGLTVGDEDGSGDDRRLRLALAGLERHPEHTVLIRAAIGRVLSEVDATGFFADVGIPDGDGFLDELVERLHRRFLPAPRDRRDLADIVRHIFTSEAAVARLQRQPAEVLDRLFALMAPEGGDGVRLAEGFADAIRILAARIAGEAGWARLRSRLGDGHRPFQDQQRAAWALADAWRSGPGGAADPAPWRAAAAACHEACERVRAGLTSTGVDLSVIGALERIRRCLGRLERLVAVAAANPGIERADAVRRLLAHLATQAWQDRSVGRLADDHLRHLHQRIVERTGTIGEHYIAKDAKDYRHILLASLGGGLLTVFTAAGKVAVAALHGPVAVVGWLSGANYAVSFLAMQHLGLMLATKQPAMTAAALAGEMRHRDGEGRAAAMADLSARICASQLAAAGANVLAVGIGALAFDQAWGLLTGHAWMDAEKAAKTLTSLSPVHSLTIAYAALTGVILWASSLIGGWADNWNAYHRVGAGLIDRGSGWSIRIGRAMDRHLAGWATNVSLGFMLGFTPALGEAFGVPLDVRHVTLNTGILMLACSATGLDALSVAMVIWAALGIASMFVLNLGVSFLLSFLTAARANGMTGADLRAYAGALLAHLRSRPGDFLRPR